MQTFLPYPGFAASARVLDVRRLGKQRVEALQVLRGLIVPGHGWRHHPPSGCGTGTRRPSSSRPEATVPSRTAIARAAVEAARNRSWPLFTGNGFLCREVMALDFPGQAPILPLHGGMGLAGGVAADYLLARPCTGAIVLEGDGNHLMGWGCAQFIGDQQLPVVHIVSANGVYRSTGGQRVPRPTGPDHVHAAAKVLAYRTSFSISTEQQLHDVLAEAVHLDGPSLLYVTEDPTEDAPPRSTFVTADYAQALTKTLAVTDTNTEPAKRAFCPARSVWHPPENQAVGGVKASV